MKIGLIDVDNRMKLDKCFPNLVLMKLSAYHKKNGSEVEWYSPHNTYDTVYASKVFSFTEEIHEAIRATRVMYGGSGYCIELKNDKEVYNTEKSENLPFEIEHIYPDYELYGIKDTAYGFMSRGCPRGCGFCHVAKKEGRQSYKVADLNEFWNGQKNIVLMDPNTFACKDWKDITDQLIDSGAYVDFNQGVDARILTPKKIEQLSKIKIRHIHFAYDRYEDKPVIEKALLNIKEKTGWARGKVTVYILTNYDTTIEQDLDRIMFCRSLDFNPYVMRYNKGNGFPRGHILNKLARWVNVKQIFWKCDSFERYLREYKQGLWH